MTQQRMYVLCGMCLAAVLGTYLFVDPIPQSSEYHRFADGRAMFGIPNFMNTMSNLAYLVPGIMGLQMLNQSLDNRKRFVDQKEVIPFAVVFVGSLFLAFGSGFYHLSPDNWTLVADRMTMTIGFMGVFCFVISERISVLLGARILPWSLALGLFSVIYWIYSEILGAGDLRLYGLVQFLPLALIALMLATCPARYSHTSYVWWALISYGAAKIFEQLDQAFWLLSAGTMSGHTLKHLVSGFGIYLLVKYVRARHSLGDSPNQKGVAEATPSDL